ncbi:hypothetical protein VL04_19670 [Chromobacterium violaceum]|uniref:hypothetical protein n=1 Tax=Chromobacterium violaceum TaxID=536 RepID=UPI0006533F40|nr:hypothetical protein [Chromobacterium violaceum]KMN47374.1 hypothetical protein VK93_21400 [Chromobacterium violaceum]KMN84465.1 hypothetical protein VL02_19950 [Chromobacterium violaceum]KMN88540.1 hypothetical protein VL04_19670 [Chromobacterium violaceum]KMO02450.1 hypothetical protein VL16_18960 [Chromobacterium violaceum]
MIYQRRALQRRLNELREVLDDEEVSKLAERLNRAGRDRVAAMWELVVFHGLSKCGHLKSEVPLASGRRPDIHFEQDGLRLIADVTAICDENLDKDNPYRELIQLIEAAKNKLKLPTGGLDLRIRAKHENTKRGKKTTLLLPPREKLQTFVSQTIVPQLREQMAAGTSPLRIVIDDHDADLDIIINPTKSPYNFASFATYDVPQIKDQNPLYKALKSKAEQLRGAQGITGVIVGDGDCCILSDRSLGWGEVSAKQIIDEFFRQYSSVDFVLLLSVRESRLGWAPYPPPVRQNHPSLFIREGCDTRSELNTLFQSMIKHFPRPAMMPVNGALRAREDDYSLGHHGGYVMSGSNVVRLGLREFTEIFAGLRSIQDNGAKNVKAARKFSQEPNQLQAVLLRNLMEGRLPDSIDIIQTDEENNDNWVEIRFGEIDPAIAPLQ